MQPLSKLEIFEIASEIAERIKNYLDEQWYDKTEISLQINWSQKPTLGAWASIEPSLESPSRHSITLTYELVEAIYSEAFDYSLFAKSKIPNLDIQQIPDQFEILQAAEFMFESGIRFIIFHELGHINQNHAAIRTKYDAAITSSCTISEFEIQDENKTLTGNLASIYHATELSADLEALDWMASVLEQQFSGVSFVDHAYLQCAIVSCIMLMFNGDRHLHIDAAPIGSHPYPALRMELWVKAYAERSLLLSEGLDIKTNGNEITKQFMDSSFLAILKWMTRNQLPSIPQYTDFCKGAMLHQNHDSYMREIINLWSNEYEESRNARKYGGVFSVLYFSDEYRVKVGATNNTETLEEHVTHCLNAIQKNSP